MFHEYPTSIPTAAVVSLVMDALRNKDVDVKEAVHATWHVIGYGLGRWDVHPLMMGVVSSSAASISDEECCEKLAALLAPQSSEGAEGVGEAEMIPWNLIAPVLLQLILRLLAK